ncbi:MAG: hypothetical protein KDD15_33510, partial [Lewinella sp.]|nr:hypothetical protein [Lewinella sp.]
DKGLICIKWAGKFINEDSVTKALVAREDWCYDNLSLESDDNFNEYGDMIYTYLGSLDELNDSEFFDFYDEELEEAYKIYSIKSDSEIDKETAEEIKRFLSNGKTKNGLLIERAFLVAQDRDQAIRLLIRARELGLDDVLYFETLDGDRILWSTDPSGDWRTK